MFTYVLRCLCISVRSTHGTKSRKHTINFFLKALLGNAGVMGITCLCRCARPASAPGAPATRPNMIGARGAHRRDASLLIRSTMGNMPAVKVLGTTGGDFHTHDRETVCEMGGR